MSNNEIWVVVATGRDSATILANVNGTSRVIKRLGAANRAAAEAEPNVIHLSNHLAYLARPTARLARDVMTFLGEAARFDAYEGVVIVASPAMRRDLHLAMDRRVHDLIIAEILEDAPPVANPAVFDDQPARRAAGSDVR
ncbi:MAG: hypothetical protein WDN08_00480 [Rhizomicrobium sp.]